jgi:hypothetical protein
MDFVIRVNQNKSLAWSVLLVMLGVIALFAGAKSLILIIPAAALVWYEARPILRSGRN